MIRARIEVKLLPKLFGKCVVPGRVKGPQVSQKLADLQPIRQVAVFAQVSHARQHADWIAHRVAAKDPHAPALRLQESKDVLDQRGLACPILAHQAKDRASLHCENDPIEGDGPAEAAR